MISWESFIFKCNCFGGSSSSTTKSHKKNRKSPSRTNKPRYQYAKSSLLSTRPFLFALAAIYQSDDKIISKQSNKERRDDTYDRHQSHHCEDGKSVRGSLKPLTGLQLVGSQANLHGCEYHDHEDEGAEHPSDVLHEERTIGVIIGIVAANEWTMLRTSPKAMNQLESLKPKLTEMISSIDPVRQFNLQAFSNTLNESPPLRPRDGRNEIQFQREMKVAFASDQPSIWKRNPHACSWRVLFSQRCEIQKL